MTEIALSSAELREFSVPDVFCFLGERQYLLGLGGIMVASSMRIKTTVDETPEDFRLRVSPADAQSSEVQSVIGAWQGALEEAARDEDQLFGLDIHCEFPEPDLSIPIVSRMKSPAMAVTLATALCGHRRQNDAIQESELAQIAGEMLEKVMAPKGTYPSRYDALCRTCVEGGVRHVKASGETLNAQLLVPPESLLLAVNPQPIGIESQPRWGKDLLSALQKLGGTETLLQTTEKDGLKGLFGLVEGKLSDQEIAVLYALVRVRRMLQEILETLDEDVRDNDRMAEICDEESTMMRDYFDFPEGNLRDVRHKAVEAGALGAKFTYVFGEYPGLLALAPGRREEVLKALREEYGDQHVLPLDVDHAGVRSERL